MKMRILPFLVLLFSQAAFAQSMLVKGQSEEPEYFPAWLMQQEGVRGVTAYETEIDDPRDQARSGNRIRMARIMTYDSYFNLKGLRTRIIHYQKGTNKLRDHLSYTYTTFGFPKKTTYVYPQASNVRMSIDSENVDSTAIIHRRETINYYLDRDHLAYQLVMNVNSGKRKVTDSLSFAYDITGRLEREIRYIMGDSVENSVERQFKHGQRSLTIYTLNKGVLLNREINRKDLQGRLILKEYFQGKNQHPRYRKQYSYNAEGHLTAVTYTYDWKYYEKEKCVISRKNIYDDRGKLIEAQLDYGDGKYRVNFYDYSYYSDTN